MAVKYIHDYIFMADLVNWPRQSINSQDKQEEKGLLLSLLLTDDDDEVNDTTTRTLLPEEIPKSPTLSIPAPWFGSELTTRKDGKGEKKDDQEVLGCQPRCCVAIGGKENNRDKKGEV